jgi:hypothetical protein
MQRSHAALLEHAAMVPKVFLELWCRVQACKEECQGSTDLHFIPPNPSMCSPVTPVPVLCEQLNRLKHELPRMGGIFPKTHSSSITVTVVQEKVLPILSVRSGQVDPIPALLQNSECRTKSYVLGLDLYLIDFTRTSSKKKRK